MSATAWSPARSYVLEAKYEFLKQVRMPAYAVPALAFPVMFYMLFGVLFGGARQAGAVTVATYMLATYGAFGVIGSALFGFGVGVAIERGQGWMSLKRATPMPPFAYFSAKLAMSSGFAAAIVFLLVTCAVAFGGVQLTAGQWLRLIPTLILGAIPFAALGLALGMFSSGNAAPAIVNLVYLPLSFASGLWIPIEVLPPAVRSVAPYLPPYHLGQLALAAVGAGRGAPAWTHVLALLGFAAVGLAVAWIGLRRDDA